MASNSLGASRLSGRASPEYKATQGMFEKLVDHCKICLLVLFNKLFTISLLTKPECGELKAMLDRQSEYQTSSRFVDRMLWKIESDSSYFNKFVSVLKASELTDVAEDLKSACRDYSATVQSSVSQSMPISIPTVSSAAGNYTESDGSLSFSQHTTSDYFVALAGPEQMDQDLVDSAIQYQDSNGIHQAESDRSSELGSGQGMSTFMGVYRQQSYQKNVYPALNAVPRHNYGQLDLGARVNAHTSYHHRTRHSFGVSTVGNPPPAGPAENISAPVGHTPFYGTPPSRNPSGSCTWSKPSQHVDRHPGNVTVGSPPPAGPAENISAPVGHTRFYDTPPSRNPSGSRTWSKPSQHVDRHPGNVTVGSPPPVGPAENISAPVGHTLFYGSPPSRNPSGSRTWRPFHVQHVDRHPENGTQVYIKPGSVATPGSVYINGSHGSRPPSVGSPVPYPRHHSTPRFTEHNSAPTDAVTGHIPSYHSLPSERRVGEAYSEEEIEYLKVSEANREDENRRLKGLLKEYKRKMEHQSKTLRSQELKIIGLTTDNTMMASSQREMEMRLMSYEEYSDNLLKQLVKAKEDSVLMYSKLLKDHLLLLKTKTSSSQAKRSKSCSADLDLMVENPSNPSNLDSEAPVRKHDSFKDLLQRIQGLTLHTNSDFL